MPSRNILYGDLNESRRSHQNSHLLQHIEYAPEDDGRHYPREQTQVNFQVVAPLLCQFITGGSKRGLNLNNIIVDAKVPSE